jgi:hypothetical protein
VSFSLIKSSRSAGTSSIRGEQSKRQIWQSFEPEDEVIEKCRSGLPLQTGQERLLDAMWAEAYKLMKRYVAEQHDTTSMTYNYEYLVGLLSSSLLGPWYRKQRGGY